MDECNPVARSLAIPPASQLPPELLRLLCGPIWEIIALICRFRDGRLAPRASYDFEQKLYELLREVGRVIVQWSYNGHEAGGGEVLPARLRVEGVWYRRNTRKTANRCVATLFGTITLMRFGYRPIDELVPGLFPLELRLGLEAARATPALAAMALSLSKGPGWAARRPVHPAVGTPDATPGPRRLLVGALAPQGHRLTRRRDGRASSHGAGVQGPGAARGGLR
jgi:hypothetical protein